MARTIHMPEGRPKVNVLPATVRNPQSFFPVVRATYQSGWCIGLKADTSKWQANGRTPQTPHVLKNPPIFTRQTAWRKV